MGRPLCGNCPDSRCSECPSLRKASPPDYLRSRPGEPEPLSGCGHYTGKCGHCGSNDLWDDNLAYGCNSCGKFWCGF
jgi:hypothetical protein